MLRKPVSEKHVNMLKKLFRDGSEKDIDANLKTLRSVDFRKGFSLKNTMEHFGRVRLLDFVDKSGKQYRLVIKKCKEDAPAEKTINYIERKVENYNELYSKERGVVLMPRAHILKGRYLVMNYIDASNISDLRFQITQLAKRQTAEIKKAGFTLKSVLDEARSIAKKMRILEINLFFVGIEKINGKDKMVFMPVVDKY